jgi:hypothetical protein
MHTLLPNKQFSPRDLRQTAKSRMGEIGLSKDMRGMIQDHDDGGVASKHYDRADYMPDIKKALDAWGERIVAIVNQDISNVTPIKESVS